MVDADQSYMRHYMVEAPLESLYDKVARHTEETAKILAGLPPEKADLAYAEGKWTVRQLVGHILVAHRIFVTRAVCASRGEQKPLPGFDENSYALNWPPESIGLPELATAYAAEAEATRNWIGWMTEEELNRVGEANGIRFRPEQILRALIGHERHHLGVLQERYGLKLELNLAPGGKNGKEKGTTP